MSSVPPNDVPGPSPFAAWRSRAADRLMPLPPTDDPARTRAARVLRAFVLIHLAVNVAGMGIAPMTRTTPLEWGVMLAGLAAGLVSGVLVCRNYVSAPSIIEMVSLSLLSTIYVIGNGSNPATPSGILVLVILGSGLLIGRKAVPWAVTYGLVSITLVLVSRWLPIGSASPDLVKMAFGPYVLAIAAILFSGVLVSHGLGVVDRAIARSKRDEDALRASEERWRSYIEHASDLIFTLDTRARIVTANRAVCRALGRSKQRLVGARAVDFVVPQQRKKAAESLWTVLSGGISDQWEYEVIGANGQPIVLEVRSRTIYEDDRAVGSLHIARDLTDRRRAEAALNEAEKRESLALLSGGVAHDFNNLLTAVMGKASAAEAMLPEDSPALPPLRGALHAADRAAVLTRQLLAYAGRASIRSAPLDLNALIDDQADLLASSLMGGVRLVLRLAPELPLIEADSAQLQQVVMNLVLNAAQAYDTTGLVLLVTDVLDLPEGLPASATRTAQPLAPGRFVRLLVRDDGDGMAPATLARVFDPFFSTKDEGHGLGLAATLGIVRGHGGGLTVESEEGVGTTFTLLFPVVGVGAAAGAEEGAPDGDKVGDGAGHTVGDEVGEGADGRAGARSDGASGQQRSQEARARDSAEDHAGEPTTMTRAEARRRARAAAAGSEGRGTLARVSHNLPEVLGALGADLDRERGGDAWGDGGSGDGGSGDDRRSGSDGSGSGRSGNGTDARKDLREGEGDGGADRDDWTGVVAADARTDVAADVASDAVDAESDASHVVRALGDGDVDERADGGLATGVGDAGGGRADGGFATAVGDAEGGRAGGGFAMAVGDAEGGRADVGPAYAAGSAVLVIDDEAAVREAIADILGIGSIPVLEAEDGLTGLNVAAARHDEIGLVLLDLTMPGLSGEETCRRLRSASPDLPVVLISGYTETKLDARYEALGVREFLAKPFNFVGLTELVGRYVG